MTEKAIYTIAEVAALMGLSRQTVTASLRMSGVSSSSGVPSSCTSGPVVR